jgi:crotonobetainyl-CoA:carnitine CoA-transferase CaiB-like acyl-CoA transferase
VNKVDVSPDPAELAPVHSGRVGPLAGLRVLDLTHMLAGPYCTWVLGALGAEVTKVEIPDGGDFTRGIAPFANGASIYFSSVNRNKRSITLNLKQPAGRAALLRLAERADVFVENNRPGAMGRLGLDYKAIARINPEIIYASISGFGQTGPYRERPAFDAVVQAMSGMMSITGEENGPPARVGASIGDIGGSLFGTIGILAALADRAITGHGAHVDVAMFDSQIALLENALARYLNAGDRPKRLGSRHPLIAPFQAFSTKDDPLVVCVDTEAQWKRFCETVQRSDLIENPLFVNGNARASHHAELEPQLAAALSKRTRAEWLAAFKAAEVPAGPINDIPAVVEDPQVQARGMIGRLGDGAFVRQPVHFSTYPEIPEQPSPRLGEHTETVLTEYGYSRDEIAAMKAEGAI